MKRKRHTPGELVHVSVVSTRTSASGTIRTTVGHPFWVSDTHGAPAPIADAGSPHFAKTVNYATDASGKTVHASQGWVFATDIRAGYTLSSTSKANPVETAQVHTFDGRATKVYNFRVAETHTYFVTPTGTLDTATWVHNTNTGKVPDPAAQGPRRPSGSIKNAALEAAKDSAGNPRCAYCGVKLSMKPGKANSVHLDHVNPYSKGGATSTENIVVACQKCNLSKGAKTPEQWGGP